VKIDESIQPLVISKLSLFFLERCQDKSTLSELVQISIDESSWSNCYDLFQRIRKKTLETQKALGRSVQFRRTHFKFLECQYHFEEVCAKTLYNLSRSPAPFDRNSSDRVIPNALKLAEQLDMDEQIIYEVAQVNPRTFP